MKKVSVTALPELAAVKVEAGSSCEPGQKATPPPELAAVKQEVDIEEHDLLQHPRVQAVMQTVSVLDTLFATDRQGNLLTLLESNVSTRTVGPPIISGSNINTEPDLISVKVCRVKTEKELILNKSKIIVKVVLEDCAQELRRSGRFCAKCQVLFPNRSGFISHGTVHESIYAPADVTDSSEGNSTPQALNASDAIQKYDESAKSSSAANCSLRCGHCDYSCVAAETLLRHGGLHDPARRHECTVCHYRFLTLSVLNTHLKPHTEIKPYECNLCKYKSSYKHLLIRHIKQHANEKLFKCNLCDYRCSQKYSLTRHMTRHTKDKPFQCDLCDYRCSYKESLSTKEKPFKCDLCEYKSSWKQNLNIHMSQHTEDKPFNCDLCDYKCSQKHNLNRHKMNRHTKEKPFKYDLCESRSSWNENLIKQIKRHTKEKPFNCDLCDYKCNRKHSIKRHKLSRRTKEKPFKCDLCEYRCYRKDNLKRHSISRHIK